MADDKLIDNNIIGELLTKESMDETISDQHSLHIIKEKLISISGVKSIYDWDQLFHSLLSGETIILMDNANEALSISTVGGEKRALTEPSTELTIRGSRIGFIERIRTNTSLIRSRIKTPTYGWKRCKLGK